jgi:hypothetical protein
MSQYWRFVSRLSRLYRLSRFVGKNSVGRISRALVRQQSRASCRPWLVAQFSERNLSCLFLRMSYPQCPDSVASLINARAIRDISRRQVNHKCSVNSTVLGANLIVLSMRCLFSGFGLPPLSVKRCARWQRQIPPRSAGAYFLNWMHSLDLL